jgi:hypothetical protein
VAMVRGHIDEQEEDAAVASHYNGHGQ